MADEKNSPTGAVILSYISGILVLLSGLIVLLIGSVFTRWMMSGRTYGMMYGYVPGFIGSMMTGMGLWGLVCGVIIIVGAWMISTSPADNHTTWGVLILVFSLLSYFGGGGFFIGGILGIIGGILALTWKPPQAPEAPKTTT